MQVQFFKNPLSLYLCKKLKDEKEQNKAKAVEARHERLVHELQQPFFSNQQRRQEQQAFQAPQRRP